MPDRHKVFDSSSHSSTLYVHSAAGQYRNGTLLGGFVNIVILNPFENSSEDRTVMSSAPPGS